MKCLLFTTQLESSVRTIHMIVLYILVISISLFAQFHVYSINLSHL